MKREPGTYALVLRASNRTIIQVGGLGSLRVRPGFYVYVGSAFGPGGVHARVSRHLADGKLPHWHVDYLMEAARVTEVWYTHSSRPREHEWARAVARLPGASVPMKGFGSSDCTCLAHLYYFGSRPSPRALAAELGDPELPGLEAVGSGAS